MRCTAREMSTQHAAELRKIIELLLNYPMHQLVVMTGCQLLGDCASWVQKDPPLLVHVVNFLLRSLSIRDKDLAYSSGNH